MIAHQEGLITEEDITIAAERLFTTRVKLGMFDESCEYDCIPYEVNDCPEHNAKSHEAARKCIVMLKNNGVLPLDKSSLKTIGVIGPNADNQLMLKGNYHGTASEYVTIVEGIREAIDDNTRLFFSDGCHLFKEKLGDWSVPDDRLSEALAVCEQSDVVILCLGMDADIEGEQGDDTTADTVGDKKDLELPGRQQKLLETVVSSGKPVILVLGVGSALAINYAQEHCAAILNAWYPGSKGGRAVADILFGKCSPGGKLPLTFYKSTDDLTDFTDYSMENRTYRYFSGEPLYPFGYGLTYSTVEVSNLDAPETGKAGEPLNITDTLTNTGSCDVEEVVQCYIKNIDSVYAPRNHSLCSFKRLLIKSGESLNTTLTVSPSAFEVVNNDGERVLDTNRHCIYVGLSQPDTRSVELTGQKPLSFKYELM
jgi:beta-glucosidase